MAAKTPSQQIKSLLEEIKRLGATVEFEDPPSKKELSTAEKQLGFELPQEAREFFLEFGGFSIELVRTWFFYGIGAAVEKSEEYNDEFEEAREEVDEDDDDAPYYPSRFLVLIDEGDYANAASGWVYDADLKALLRTDGDRMVEREDAYEDGYWEKVIEELGEIRDRLSDPDDPIVSGQEEIVNARRKIR